MHDNFFELGGDSILSIQVVSRATPRGAAPAAAAALPAPDAGPARPGGGHRGDRGDPGRAGRVSGPVALTPVQRWFFAQEIPERRPLEHAAPAGTAPTGRRGAAGGGAARVVAAPRRAPLPLRRACRGRRWSAAYAPADEPRPGGAGGPLGGARVGARGADRAAPARRRTTRLDLEHGPLLRAVLLEPGGGRPPRLLLSVHHLVVDVVSWRILLEDLQAACEQLERGEAARRSRRRPHRSRSGPERLAEHTPAAASTRRRSSGRTSRARCRRPPGGLSRREEPATPWAPRGRSPSRWSREGDAGAPPRSPGRLPHADRRRAPLRPGARVRVVDRRAAASGGAGGARARGVVRGGGPVPHGGVVHHRLPGAPRPGAAETEWASR